EIGGYRDVAGAVVALDALRTSTERYLGNVVQGNETGTARYQHRADALDVAARLIVEPYTDGDLPVRQVELRQAGGDVAAGGDPGRGTEHLSRHAELRRPLRIG